ncbi:MAG TPA: Ig-like domain-containing protein, partial [Gemmataceae bacterium]|nr:Ig-like domain-containing protein [Gemmataceae bacterium]
PAIIEPADVVASADVFVNSLVPAQVLVRGKFLDTATPTYYALSLTRRLQVQLLRVVNGYTTVLAQMDSADYVTGQWIHMSLTVSGSTLKAQIYRLDKAQYLNSSGQWQTAPTLAIGRSDTSITGVGEVGLARAAGVTGTLSIDNFSTVPAFNDTQSPSVAITWPRPSTVLSDTVNFQAQADDDVGVAKVEFYVDDTLTKTETIDAYQWSFDTKQVANGPHELTVLAYDWAGNVGRASINVTVQNLEPLPIIPRHYSYIRIAELAYSGNPMGAFEDQLLLNSVDLVVSATNYLSEISSIGASTPRLVYLNVSNIYSDLLTSWLSYADSHGLSREDAFFHVFRAVPFSGNSPSSQPVNWFWKVYTSGTGWTDATSKARGGRTSGVSFGGTGQSLYVGYPDKFREINVSLASAAAGRWSAALEYPTAVDTYGRPTAWGMLPTISNTTSGLTRSGQILFDPPADWKAASINGSARLYYARFATISAGTAPVAEAILGRDYVNARGTTAGTIPAFDSNADLNHDGYLNDAEYAHRRPGMDARFLYESRVFYGNYGQMRFASNPSNESFRNWAVDYAVHFLNGIKLATGIFMDNSSGKIVFDPTTVREATDFYSTDYGNLLHMVNKAIAPRFVLANTSGGGMAADTVIQQTHVYFEEFAIRPLAHNFSQFLDLATQVSRRNALRPTPFAVLDSLPTGGSPTDPRTQLATLAYYYLLANPATTFLDLYGGYEPNTTWSRHWIPAINYNVGQPLANWFTFASGLDPANRRLTYHVYGRQFGRALVLYKPLSYASGVSGSLANTTATTHSLGGTYYPLHADGTLGSAVTSITLRNGEGAILIKA